jgi:hypothetical protein
LLSISKFAGKCQSLNSSSAVGWIFLIIGFILLVVGFAQGANAIKLTEQIFGEYASQLRGTVFWNSAGSYIVASLVCFVIGGVGLYAGSTKIVGGETATLSRPTPMVANVSQIRCGSCGTMNDIDAVFCKKCGNHLR